MLIANLKEKSDGIYYCSNCRMRANLNKAYCLFCGAEWSNYIEVQDKIWKYKEKYE